MGRERTASLCRVLNRPRATAALASNHRDHPPDQQQSFSRVAEMPRITCRSWTAEQIKLLCALVERGISPARASVVLKRPRLAVQNKARELGRPFAGSRQVRAMRLTKEADARKAIERSAQNVRPDPEGMRSIPAVSP
jgi:hypothetical protein